METTTNAPVLKLRTERGLLKMVLLGIVTFGIYPLVVESHISEELNIVAPCITALSYLSSLGLHWA